MRRVAITGVGLVCPIGNDVASAWPRALSGESGVRRIARFDSSQLTVHIAAEVKDFELQGSLDAKEGQRASLFVQYAAKAAAEALHDSGIKGTMDPERIGTAVGVGLGALGDIEENTIILKEKGQKRVSPFFLPYTIPNMAAGVISRVHNLKGPNMCTTTACTSGTHGIGEAFLYIKSGLADAMLAGGSEAAISPLGVASFATMKALSTNNDDPARASRPFDLNRDGFVMGEGAGVLVLEEWESARRRGAKIYAEMIGYGMSADAYHITSPSPDGEGAQRCMRSALQTAGVGLDEVDHINAHGTSTKLNDAYESMAIAKVFGTHVEKISICSTKGVTGHCLGAAGGIEGVFSVLALHHQIVPPTANYTTRDPECPLDYTASGAHKRSIRVAISNSFGFGGTNGTLVFRRFS